MRRLFIGLSFATLATVAYAQEKPKCADKAAQAAEQGEAETPPAAGPDAGTAPGGSSSTGWTGGLGGSNIGTSPTEETPESPQDHPKVATGLDPIGSTTSNSEAKPDGESDC